MPDKVVLRSWLRCQDYLKAGIRNQQWRVVSLDIFDTLLARIDTPEQVQRATCRLLAGRLEKRFSVDEIWLQRQQAERELREQAVANGLDHECRFSDLVPLWISQLTGQADPGLCQFVEEQELALEKQALYVKEGVEAFLQWLSIQPVAIYAVSDMYLDGAFIRELLEEKGLLRYFSRVYVSADQQLAKYSGRLFEWIAQEHAIDLNSWAHIGDNPVSDRRAACACGLQGIWLYEKSALRYREYQQLQVDMAQRGGLWKGQHFFSVLQERLRMSSDNQKQDDFFYKYGRDVLGGAFSTFTLGLHERLQRKPVDKVFFVARDGFLLQQLYQQLDTKQDEAYIYLSRKVITAASVAEGLTREQAQVAFYNPKQQGLRSVCKVYGLPEAELEPFAQLYGFADFAEPIHDWYDSRLLNFLDDEQVQDSIRPHGRKHRELLENYLEQMGFFDKDSVALVDIGWNGTVQKFLKQAFGERADFPVVHGYYFAFVPKMYGDFGKNNFCEGIIHDARRDNACERIPAEFEEIFEQGARAQEATTVGYCRADGKVEPVLKSAEAADRRAELACNEQVAAIQRGIMTHWQHFLAVQHLTGYSSQDVLPYVYGQLERAIVYPTRTETEKLTRLVHTEDFGDDHILDLGKQALSWRDLLRPMIVWRRLRESAWRYALFASIPTGIANFALRVAYLHAVRK